MILFLALFHQAVPERVNLFRAQSLRSLGGNGWRMSHNPYRDTLYDTLDRLGVLVRSTPTPPLEYTPHVPRPPSVSRYRGTRPACLQRGVLRAPLKARAACTNGRGIAADPTFSTTFGLFPVPRSGLGRDT